MYTQIKTSFLFYTFTLFVCLSSFLLLNAAAQIDAEPEDASASPKYTFESIEVPGVDFLALTASSDFEDYAGYTKNADGKIVAFTLIDDIFETYDFPDAQETRFYALGNNGDAAGYYVDSDGHHRGVVLENGELRQYDFPGSVQTEIYGISDTTGALTGNFIDANDSKRRGFSGDEIIEVPGATATYADFVNSRGGMVGSYVDAAGVYQPYIRTPTGRFVSIDLPRAERLEYFFVHGINDAQTIVSRTKVKVPGGVPLTYVGAFREGLKPFTVPGSVSTEGYNINQDGSIVGHYDTPDGRRHGFIARPAVPGDDEPAVPPVVFNYTFESIDVPGVAFLALTASSDFEDYAGYTQTADGEKEVAFTLIDGVFTTYDFPGSQKTHFYALGNNGNAAGHYQDSEGLYHGVVLENGELRQYDFEGAVQTEIYGISDATGALTGNFIDASGVRRGFSGDTIVEYPGAAETYADFVNASGRMVGSYVDAAGIYHAYARGLDGRFTSFDLQTAAKLEYFFLHGINDAGTIVGRTKPVGEVPRTYVGTLRRGLAQIKFPGSVSTEGWNINQDGSIVGHYESADGRVHGFIARLTRDAPAQVDIQPVAAPDDSTYTFESIEVSGVNQLALTASSDFGDYAGYTQSADGEKNVGFTIIDGVFTTYDFPGSQETRFYALGNNGNAAGYYVDSDGHHRGVVLENGELRQYDFPDAVQTEIYGISDATGALTGNYIDASGVRRGFSGDIIVEYPGASETYADFVDAHSGMVGSYIDAEGKFHAYLRTPAGRFLSFDNPFEKDVEHMYVHGINDAGILVARVKFLGELPTTFVGSLYAGLQEFKIPGSLSTEGWNVNQDGSIVGHYVSADGRTHGFVASVLGDSVPPVSEEPPVPPDVSDYIFETIDVPGVDFLELTASNDFEDYAGNTLSPDGKKTVGFTLIDDVFTTYDFPGSKNTFFYALGNDLRAAGHYEDNDGLFHGVILENGELRRYDFPGAAQTFIFGISDATGALSGNMIDETGVRRGFSGETVVEAPGARQTYSDFVNADGTIVGSYVDAEGLYHAYVRSPGGAFILIDLHDAEIVEYLFVHGINDAGISVARAKLAGELPTTYIGAIQTGMQELKFPGSVSTEGWNINQDGSVVGNYISADGRRHGFNARPVSQAKAESYGNAYTVSLSKGLNMLSLPLAPSKPMNARSLAGIAGATTVITLDPATQRFVAWTPGAPDDGFPIEGAKGYIVNVPQSREFAFVGAPWSDETEGAAAAPPVIAAAMQQETWAFVVSGRLEGKPASEWLTSAVENPAFDGYQVIVRNLRTNSVITASVQGDYFAAATADLARRSVVEVGDVIEVRVIAPDGNVESQTHSIVVNPENLENAVLSVRLGDIGKPKQSQLLQNYPNPFNPETWIPYQLAEDGAVSVSIYDTTGVLIHTLPLGFQSAGFYNGRARAAYWDGRNALGEQVASGVYFYQLRTPSFQQTRRLVIVK